ncbi:MAG: hypothetical protein ABI180_17570 [Microcoleus sp.]
MLNLTPRAIDTHYRSQPTIILPSADRLLPSKQQPPSGPDRPQPPENQEF